MSFFTATFYFEGYYLKGNVVVNGENKSVQENRLETLPRWISRNRIRFQHEILSATLQYSYVADSFSDAMNTQIPSPEGAKGIVPDCSIMDLNLSLRFFRIVL